MYKCVDCNIEKAPEHFDCKKGTNVPILTFCVECSDKYHVEDVNCTCSVCHRNLPKTYFQHYRTRIKPNGMRLRVNRNCLDCSKKESAVVSKLKKQNPPPNYLIPCPQCNRVVYEKSEDIPEGIDGANGPWQCDHDHVTKEFRGYVCKQCNTGTGLIGDNEQYWTEAVKRKK